jgi:glycosyltransferase involved in cell wall biosynthesis
VRPSGVLFVGAFLSHGGGRRAVAEDLEARLAPLGWSARLTSRSRSRLLRVADMLWTAFRHRGEYEVAHVDVFSGAAFGWAELLARVFTGLGKPWIATLRGGGLPEFAAGRERRVRALLGSAFAVTAPSAYLQRAMRPYRAEIELIPNGIETGRYPYRHRASASPRLVWLRAFHRVYRPEMGPALVARIAADYPDTRLDMVGPDKGDGSVERTRRAAAELGVADRIEIVLGVPKAEVPERLSRADVFLNTTSVDNVPVSLLEALACGLCVATTAPGGISDLVRDGETALLFPSDDLDAMEAAVRRLFSEPALAARLSANARREAESFDWSRVVPLWDALFRRAAAAGEGRR